MTKQQLRTWLWARWVETRVHIPMWLTYARMISPAYLVPAFMSGMYKTGVFLAILAALTDLEGCLARIWHCVSQIGERADPLADKSYASTMAAIGLTLYVVYAEMAWLTVSLAYAPPIALMLVYDYRMWRLRQENLVSAPCFAGKLKTFLLMPGLIAMVWVSVPWLEWIPDEKVAFVLLWTSSIFALWSYCYQLGYIQRDCPDPRPYFARAARAAWTAIVRA